MNKRCFYTSFNKAYTPQALILAESLKSVYGNTVDIVALLVDELDGDEAQYFSAFNQILKASELNIPDFRRWIFGLDIVEAATAVKPFAMRHLLDKYEDVVYLDPDTIVYAPLDEMFDALAKNHFVLTPHQLTPSSEEWVIESTELESLRFGVFNLGFIAVRKSEFGIKIAKWWSERCYKYCVNDLSRGLFTDQKLFDLAPAFFPDLHVLRHPGYNLASWNMRERIVSIDEKSVTVNGAPLKFCHFTKASHIGALALERMSRNFSVMNELFYAYLALMEQKKIELDKLNTDWFYGKYIDGVSINPGTRKEFRKRSNTNISIKDPFESRSDVEMFVQ